MPKIIVIGHLLLSYYRKCRHMFFGTQCSIAFPVSESRGHSVNKRATRPTHLRYQSIDLSIITKYKVQITSKNIGAENNNPQRQRSA